MENPIKMDDLGGKPAIFGNRLGESSQSHTNPWDDLHIYLYMNIVDLYGTCRYKYTSPMDGMGISTLPETNSNILPLKRGMPNRKYIFQPSIFRGELLVSGRVSD